MHLKRKIQCVLIILSMCKECERVTKENEMDKCYTIIERKLLCNSVVSGISSLKESHLC